jgi:hypothetical protein
MEVTVSSAVNLPIMSARLRSGVVWMGDTFIRCTYCGTRKPLRFTFTTNFVFFMIGYYFFYSTPTVSLYSLPWRLVKNRDAPAAKVRVVVQVESMAFRFGYALAWRLQHCDVLFGGVNNIQNASVMDGV